MADYRCSIKNCSEIPKFLCLCEDPPIKLCMIHIESHSAAGIGRDHTIKPIFAQLDSEEILILQQTRARLLQMKGQSISEISQKYLAKIKGINEQFSEQIKAAKTSFDNFIALLDKSLASNFALRSSTNEMLLKLKALSNTPPDRRDEELDRIILGFLDSPPSFIQSFIPVSDVKEERFNYCFQPNTKNLIQIDNHNLKKTIILLDALTENLGTYAGHCSLEDGNIFYCGGSPSQFISSCYKIDPNKKEILKLANLPGRLLLIIPTRIENHIYVFGGQNGPNLSQSLKYSIKDNRWETITNPPKNSCLNSSISVKQSILLVGYQLDGVYEYKNNTYNKIMDCSTGNNALLKNKEGEIFLLSGSKIYKSSESDYYNWKQVGSYNGFFNSHIANTPQLWGDYFCFQIHSNRYIRFNYKTLQLEEPGLN